MHGNLVRNFIAIIFLSVGIEIDNDSNAAQVVVLKTYVSQGLPIAGKAAQLVWTEMRAFHQGPKTMFLHYETEYMTAAIFYPKHDFPRIAR